MAALQGPIEGIPRIPPMSLNNSYKIEEWLQDDDPRLLVLAQKIWAWTLDILDGHRNPFFTNHMAMDHGSTHIQRVAYNLDQIIRCGPDSLRKELSPTGLFILHAATALHDIGMFYGFHLVECDPQVDLGHRKGCPGFPNRFLPCEIQHGAMKRFLRRNHGSIASRVLKDLIDNEFIDLTSFEKRTLEGATGKILSYVIEHYNSNVEYPGTLSDRELPVDEKGYKRIAAMLTLADFLHLDYSRTTNSSIQLIKFYVLNIEKNAAILDPYLVDYLFRDEYGLDPVDFLKHFFCYYIKSAVITKNTIEITPRLPPELSAETRDALLSMYSKKMIPDIRGSVISILKKEYYFDLNYSLDDFAKGYTITHDLELMPYWLITFLFAYANKCVRADDGKWQIPVSVVFLLAYAGLSRNPSIARLFFDRSWIIHQADPTRRPWEVVQMVISELKSKAILECPELEKCEAAEMEILQALHLDLKGNAFNVGVDEDWFLGRHKPPRVATKLKRAEYRACLDRLECDGHVVRRADRIFLDTRIGSLLALIDMDQNFEAVYPGRLRPA
jgi:hypothetical protein